MNNRLQRQVKTYLKKSRLRFIRWRYAFDGAALLAFLAQMGVQNGDTLMVHCRLDGFEGFTGKPRDIISTLQTAVGTSGTLVMPNLPFSGSAIDWAAQQTPFDLRRTPSAMGLVSEIFRRLPGVVRSVHPTHAVAAWGAQAAALCADHHRCLTPCGVGSPYAGLLDHDGAILLLGVDIRAMTFFHTVEEMLESRYPVSPFTSQRYRMLSRTLEGDLVATETRLFDPQISKSRDTRLMIPALKAADAWQEGRLMGLQGYRFKARSVLSVLTEMADRQQFCYRFADRSGP